MKLPSYQRIMKEDIEEEYRPLIEKIGFSINSFLQAVLTLSTNQITIKDNLFQEIKLITVEVTSSGKPTTQLQLSTTLTNQLAGIQVIKIVNNTSTTVYPTSGVFPSWSQNNKVITINHITGLVPGNNYTISLLLIGG